MNVPSPEIQQINERLRLLEQAQGRIEGKLEDLDEGFDSRIRLAMYEFMRGAGRQQRDTASWVISLIAFALMVLFSVASLAVGIWG